MAEGRPMFFQKVRFSGGEYKKITLLRQGVGKGNVRDIWTFGLPIFDFGKAFMLILVSRLARCRLPVCSMNSFPKQ
jgi:hypothetical protein